ncbi:MAG TPA: hypothetical protein VFK15_03755 [Burkholderiales bacterium]|nr:hypothetical protein [Burkholderiales bacterium]
MAFIDCSVFNREPSVTLDDDADYIRIRIGDESQIGLTAAEALRVRDALSRAITEAAQKHAQATAKAVDADAEGAQA